jgi:hypothetical protein
VLKERKLPNLSYPDNRCLLKSAIAYSRVGGFRSWRDHVGRNRHLDSGGDCRRAATQGFALHGNKRLISAQVEIPCSWDLAQFVLQDEHP